MTEPLLRVQDLRAHFRTDDGVVRAVGGLSLDVAAGESVGIVGESGSGKSVLSLSIMRLLPTPPAFFPTGAVYFEGRDLLHADARTMESIRGNRLAMIFQDPMTSLNPYLTVERQLTEVLERHRGMSRGAARLQAVDILTRVGIAEAARRIDSYPHELSGGMRQRVMIAMALLCEPALLIADEPTTALDVTIAAQILDLMRDLRSKFNTSLILITHDLGVVAGMADRIVVMYAGRAVEVATAETLYTHARHPYSAGLLRSRPHLSRGRGSKLTPIPGLPPDLSALPIGCPFRPRCERAIARCETEDPPLLPQPGGQLAACWNPVPHASSA